MVYSSVQAYLDSSNWQQPPSSSYHQITGAAASGGGGGSHLLSPRPQPPPQQPQPQSSHGTGAGSIRPGSMVDRARMANIPMPEAAQKCPRCESTNTKFCYFNNYSLTQPRHFCKNCRRYWTRGGALRNVPVGGGCRRNRRTRSNNNTSNNNGASSNNTSVTAAGGPNSTIGAVSSNYGGGGGNHESILSQILSPVRLMSPSFNQINDIATVDRTAAAAAANSIGFLNYGIVSGVSQDLSSIHMGSSLSAAAALGGGGGSLLSCLEQWRPSLPQLPALGGGNLEDSSNSSGFYPFEANKAAEESMYVRPQRISSSISSALATQLASVKVEDHNPYKWGNNGTFSSWTDLSSFGSSG